MRKSILLFMLSVAAFAVDAQRLLVTDVAKVTQKFTLSGTSVTSVSTDTTLASPTNNQLVTAKAVRDYAWKLGGRPVASTAPTSGQVMKWDGTKWAPGAAGGGATGTDGEVAVFSVSNDLVSYPELAFDGSTLNLNADLNTLKSSPTWSLVDSDASNSGGGGTLVVANFDGTAIGSGHRLGVVQFMGSTGVSGTSVGASIESYAGANWSGTSSPGGLNFLTTPSGSLTPLNRFELSRNGEARLRTGTDLLFYAASDVSSAGMAISGDSALLIYGTRAGAESETVFQSKIGLLRSGSVTLNGNVNNLYLGCGGGIVEIAATGSFNITGIQPNMLAGSSRLLFAKNASSYTLNLINESASSLADNRFSIGADFAWPAGETLLLLWNDGAHRWTLPNKALAGSGGGGGGGHVIKDDNTVMSQRDTLALISSNAIDVAATDVATGSGRTEIRLGIKTGAVGSAELESLGSAGSCTNCSMTVDADGRVSTYSSGGAQVNEYTTAQTGTSLAVPSGAKTVEIICVGSGSGGGSGRKGAAGTVRCGGGGGASGNVSILSFSVTALGSPTTLSVTVGAGGAGGASQTTNDTNGNGGGAGNASEVKVGSSTIIYAAGGATAGGGGTASAGTAGAAASPGMFQGGSGGAANASGSAGSSASGVTNCVGTGGGAGGGINTSNTASNGGGVGFSYFSSIAGPSGGTGGGNGTDGSTVTGINVGTGGSGGASSTSGNAGNGGNGARGAGGGGGGAAVNSTGNSGAGGAGGTGYVRVTFYF